MSGVESTFQALWASLWSDNSLVGKIILSTILFLLLRSVLHGRRHLRRYRNETVNLQRVTARLEQWRADQAARATAPAEPVPPPLPGTKLEPERWKSLEIRGQRPVVEIAELKEGVDESSLIFERLTAIGKMRAHQVKITLESLQKLTAARDSSKPGMSTPAFTAGMAMMLGLLGTFFGLAVMVQKIQFALPSGTDTVTTESWTGAFENVRGILFGMKTAFSASLVGIFSSIIATAIGARLRRNQVVFFEALEKFTTQDLLPATIPTAEDESLLGRITLQLENSFSYLDEIFRLNQEALKDMTGAQQAFVDIVDEIRLVTKNEASRDLEGVITQLGATNRSVLQVVQQLPAIASAIEKSHRRMIDRLSPWQQIGSGLGSLWNSRLFGAIPGAVLMIGALLLIVYWVLRATAVL